MFFALATVLLAYLMGSIPFGLIVGKIGYGKDVRQFGSGNLGATNVFRVLGLLPGIIVFVLDLLKGLLATGLASYLFPHTPTLIQHVQNPNLLDATVVVLAAMAVICGHNWSLYLKFSGGKGVATGAGVLIMLVPLIVLILTIFWAILVAATRYVSLASISIVLAFPILMLVFHPGNVPYIIFSFTATFVVVFQHRSNIKRLLAGTENKIGQSTDKARRQ